MVPIATLLTLLASIASVSAFGVTPPTLFALSVDASTSSSSLPVWSSSSSLHALVGPTSASEVFNAAQNLWIATIDSDIANIPNDEFGKVFAGGIIVMLGGVLSALIVGAILESGDLYASVAAESYLQSADDAEFWKKLNDEEKKKAETMLSRIKQAKEGGVAEEDLSKAVLGVIENESSSTISEASPAQQKKEVTKASSDLFSDYE